MTDVYKEGFDKLLTRELESGTSDSTLTNPVQPSQILPGSLDLGRIQVLPDETVGFVARDNNDNEVFKIITDGSGAGNVIIGADSLNYAQFNTTNGVFEVVSEGASIGTIYSRVEGTTDTNNTLTAEQKGLGMGMDIQVSNASNNNYGLHISHAGTGASAEGTFIEMTATTGVSDGLYISGAHLGRVAYLRASNASNTSPTLLLYHQGNGPHIQMTGDPSNSSSTDGDLWFDGTNLKINVGGSVYNIDKTAV